MSALDLDAIEARANAAQSGPWRSTWPDPAPPAHDLNDMVVESLAPGLSYAERMVVGTLWHDGSHAVCGEQNAEFIAAARTDVPALVAEVRVLRRTLALAQESLAAAVRDERVTVVDEVARLQRERDEARADAAALRAAAREYLDAQDSGDRALDSWLRADDTDRDADAAQAASRWRTTQARIALRAAIDVATMRRDLPAEAVVSCPACGYGITADLDDGAYVTRRHSRREPARVGAGEIVWCDGGIVRP